MTTQNHFGVVDYLAVGVTLVASLGIGIFVAFKGRGKQTSEDLLMGGRKMKAIPIAASMLVTYFSAIAIIGYPAEIYSNGIQIFWIHVLLTGICIPLAAFLFMTVLYKLKLTSVYEYLELRFDSYAVRALASAIFILQMTILTGVALFAPSIALEAFLDIPKAWSIIGIGLCGTIYTSIGGLKAVVWTDVFQFFLIIIGMLTIVIKGFITAGGFVQAFTIANDHGRLNLFDWTVDPFERYNTLNFLVGYGIAIVCFYGAHQPNVQRYSSLPTFKDAIKAMAWNALFKELMNILIICTGVSIFATYAGCDPIKLNQIKKADEIVPHFFIQELSNIPGMMGIFTSCIFSAVLSTLSSALNSLAAVTWQDFFSRMDYFKSMGDAGKGRITCLLSAVYGVATIALAFTAGYFGSIFQVTITVIGAFSGTLGGCFLMGLFIPCINKIGAIAGMVTGLGVTGWLTIQAVLLKVPYSTLPTTVDQCPIDVLQAANITLPYITNVTMAHAEYEWPQKLYTVSYILYPMIGSVITIVVGVVVSILTKRCIAEPPASCYDYLHPVIKRFSCCIPARNLSLDTPYKNNSHQNSNNNLSASFKFTDPDKSMKGIDNGAFEMTVPNGVSKY